MSIVDSYGYDNIVFIAVIVGLIIDVIIHLIKQMKNSGKWKIDYKNLAAFAVGTMLIMAYSTRIFSNDITISMLIGMWLFLPCYALIRNLKKCNK